jgi:hypothetical protein
VSKEGEIISYDLSSDPESRFAWVSVLETSHVAISRRLVWRSGFDAEKNATTQRPLGMSCEWKYDFKTYIFDLQTWIVTIWQKLRLVVRSAFQHFCPMPRCKIINL